MIWTHYYDLLVKISILFLSIFTLNLIPFFDGHEFYLTILSIILSTTFYILILRTFGSYLYCRITLKMAITIGEAKNLNDALSPFPLQHGDLNWLPLTEIINVEHSKKYEAALILANQWKKSKMENWVKTKEQSKGLVRLIEISIGVIFIGMLISSNLNLPPSNYFIELYCKIFNTNQYSPMLIGTLASLIFILPLILIKKNLTK